jgi:serine/threonine protein kinase
MGALCRWLDIAPVAGSPSSARRRPAVERAYDGVRQTDTPDRRALVIAGRYSLDREIGRGGTGVVWLGRDEVLGRQVALKRIGLLPGADSTDLARAEREARLSAQLNHPHVVAVFDVVVETDAHWLVMEYVDGLTLGELVREQGKLSPDEAAPLLRQAADALVAAQAAGIAHRDVKPSNILVDRSGQVKLTDFGIARIATDPSLTQTGMVTGSPAYLAPEIATGDRGGEAGDVWSLGATIFFVLSGRAPYEIGANVLSALYRIVNEEPPRLTDAGWMTPLLEGTMVRDPSRRWSMKQVRDFLADPRQRVAPTSTNDWDQPGQAKDTSGTRPLGTVGPATAPTVQPSPRAASRGPRRTPTKLLLAGLGLVVSIVLAVTLYAVLSNRDPASDSTKGPSDTTSSPAPAAEPTEEGMESFIRDYVAAVASDPETSWQMLSPKFQVESGGFETYRKFWDPATNGRVRSISANPENLSVSYQVRFDNFNNGPGPTVLDLKFEDGRYLIDGERTQGFEPAG